MPIFHSIRIQYRKNSIPVNESVSFKAFWLLNRELVQIDGHLTKPLRNSNIWIIINRICTIN